MRSIGQRFRTSLDKTSLETIDAFVALETCFAQVENSESENVFAFCDTVFTELLEELGNSPTGEVVREILDDEWFPSQVNGQAA